MKLKLSCGRKRCRAFTLSEVVISLAVSVTAVSGVIYGYIQTAKRAEWTGYSLAAHSLAMQRLEQARACKWDPLAAPAVDELVSTNFGIQVEILDVPITGTNVVYATNVTTISVLSTNPHLRMIQVTCSWMFIKKGPFTNTIISYRAPDQ